MEAGKGGGMDTGRSGNGWMDVWTDGWIEGGKEREGEGPRGKEVKRVKRQRGEKGEGKRMARWVGRKERDG